MENGSMPAAGIQPNSHTASTALPLLAQDNRDGHSGQLTAHGHLSSAGQVPSLPSAAHTGAVHADSAPEDAESASGGTRSAGPAQAPAAQGARSGPGFRQRYVTKPALEEVVHFHLTDLGRQIFVWVGLGASTSLENLALAALPPRPGSSSPASAAATALVKGTGDEVSVVLAQKLTARLQTPVLLAWTLPPNEPLLTTWAERRLTELLQDFVQK